MHNYNEKLIVIKLNVNALQTADAGDQRYILLCIHMIRYSLSYNSTALEELSILLRKMIPLVRFSTA